MNEDRHINFKLMRDRILATQADASTSTPGRSLPIYPEGKSKKAYWRSLEELVDAPEFREFVEHEFPQQAEEWDNPVERRTFLKLMGASLALAGLSGCVYQPPEKIVPYVKQPEEEVPGRALFFATAATVGGIATPVLARSNEGRPTKIEGNPDHPIYQSSDGKPNTYSATDIFAQASVLSLYDPDRSQTTLLKDESRPWTSFVGAIRTALNGPDGNSGLRAKQGAGLRFLTETVTSPTLAAQLKDLLTTFPQAKWHQYEPVNRDNAVAGAAMAFGQPVNTVYDFSKAERILSLDSDFLAAQPGLLRYTRDFAARRRITEGKQDMSRLYVIESTPSITGANADHRWSVKPSEMDGYALSLSQKLAPAKPGSSTERASTLVATSSSGEQRAKPNIEAIAKDLKERQGASIIIPGNEASPLVHALAHAMNSALGNVGKTVFYTDPIEANPANQTQSLRELISDIDGGIVELLVIVGGNPTYNTPWDLKLDSERLKKVALRVHHGPYKDETAVLCHWHIPASHYLEMWSDTRSIDGTVTIVQPLIEPLFESKSEHELLAVFSDQYDKKAYDIIRDYWRANPPSRGSQQSAGKPSPSPAAAGSNARTTPSPTPSPVTSPTPGATPSPAATPGDFDGWWRKCLHDGFIPNTALPPKTVTAKTDIVPPQQASAPTSGYEIVFRTDPSIYDGRFANNGWLQELPKPLTKVTWDNAALVSPATATKLGLNKRSDKQSAVKGRESYVDTITIRHQDRSVTGTVPVFIMPGQADDVITVHLGYGRQRAGRVGNGHGFNAYEIRPADSPWRIFGAEVGKATAQHVLATTQLHFNMEDYNSPLKDDRDILRIKTLAEYLANKPEAHESE